MGAEDFAFYTGLIPCAYLRFGCFDRQKNYTYDLHNPHFDFDEALLALGTETLTFLILKLLTGNWHGNYDFEHSHKESEFQHTVTVLDV